MIIVSRLLTIILKLKYSAGTLLLYRLTPKAIIGASYPNLLYCLKLTIHKLLEHLHNIYTYKLLSRVIGCKKMYIYNVLLDTPIFVRIGNWWPLEGLLDTTLLHQIIRVQTHYSYIYSLRRDWIQSQFYGIRIILFYETGILLHCVSVV